jgi:DNA polymerase III epsilon subunit-like protein
VYDRLINPERKIDAKASKISGITDEMVKDKKTFKEIRKKLRKLLLDCDLWVAHNEAFDRSFFNEEFTRAGIKPPLRPVFDTRIFADYLWPQGPNNLDAVSQRLRVMPGVDVLRKLGIRKERHRADYDALLCGMALFKFGSQLPASLAQTLYVQDWMYRIWFKNIKLGDTRYQRMLDPTMPPKYE